MSDHARIEELYVERSLSGLGVAQTDELAGLEAAHGSDCPECASLRDDYEEVAGRLAFALPPAAVPEGMVDRILEDRPARRASRPGSFQRAAAALAAALLLGLGAVGGYLLAPRGIPGLTDAAAFLSEPGVRISNLEGSGQGNVVMAFRPGSPDSYLIGSDLAPAPEGNVYELWLLIEDAARPAGVFDPEHDVVAVKVGSDLAGVTGAAITIERAPGAQQPTTTPIFSGPLTTA